MPCKGCLRRLVGRAATGGFTLLLALPPSLSYSTLYGRSGISTFTKKKKIIINK
jgi:hypothetical protein